MIARAAGAPDPIKRVFAHSAIYTGGNLLTRSLGFLLLPLYTRYLSPRDYGAIELAELTISLTAILVGITAVGDALIRVFHEYDAEEEQQAAVSTALMVAVVVAFSVAGLGAAAAPRIASVALGDESFAGFVALSFAAIVLTSQIELCLVYLRLRGRAGLFVLFSIIFTAGQALCNVVLIAGLGLGIWGFVLSKIACGLAGCAVLLTLVLRTTGFRWQSQAFVRMARFGAPLVWSSLAFFAIHFADRFFLAKYAALSDVGIYSVGYKFGFLITFLVGEPFGRVWNATVFGIARGAAWRTDFARVFSLFFAALLLAWCVLSLFTPALLHFMVDPQFRGASAVIPLVALAYVLRECGDFFRQILYLDKNTRLVRNIALTGAAANLALNWLLIPRWGIQGAVFATLTTWFVYALSMFVYSQRAHHIPYRLPRLGALSAIVLGSFAAIGPHRTADAQGLLWAAGGVLLVVVWLWVSGYLEHAHRATLLHRVACVGRDLASQFRVRAASNRGRAGQRS